MATRRASQLTIAYNPDWKQQAAWDDPLDNADLTAAFPATSRNYFDIDETVEDIFDCTGEDFLFEILTAEFARLTIDFDVDPDILAGLLAFAYGVAAAPSGGTDEVQTETVTASGGTRTLTVQNGANMQTTAAIPWSASAAVIQAALEALSNVGASDIIVSDGGATPEVQELTFDTDVDGGTYTLSFGGQTTTPLAWDANAATIQAALEALSTVEAGDIVVAGSGPFTFTFGGNLGGNQPQITIDITGLTDGGGAVSGDTTAIATTTPGVLGTRVYTFSGAGFSKRNVNMISVNTFGLTGGSSSFAETTPGVGRTHAISRLTGYSMPLMTLYVGFRGSSEQPMIFKNVAVDSVRVRSASRERVTGTVQLVGTKPTEFATGFTMPDCQDILPIRFADCGMSIAGTDYIANELGREFEYYFENGIVPKFDGASTNPTRIERADQRPSQFSFWVLGEPGDPIHDLALMRQSFPVALRLGPVGRSVTCTAPQALVKLAPTPLRFGGDPAESELAIVARPRKVSGDAATPTTVTAVISETATMLTPDS